MALATRAMVTLLAQAAGFCAGARKCEQTGLSHLEVTISSGCFRVCLFNKQTGTEASTPFHAMGEPFAPANAHDQAVLASMATLFMAKLINAIMRLRHSVPSQHPVAKMQYAVPTLRWRWRCQPDTTMVSFPWGTG